MTIYGGGTASRGPAVCPDCGKPVPPGDIKLCRYCGYPLMFESTTQADHSPAGFLRKPDHVDRVRDSETGLVGAALPQTFTPREQLGPHCPNCGHRNAARRVRCEVCAAELWPGAATPMRRVPMPGPATPMVGKRRANLTVLAVIAAAVVAVVAVYLLAYALA
jgi:predicted amidophosphoribosyltransferase